MRQVRPWFGSRDTVPPAETVPAAASRALPTARVCSRVRTGRDDFLPGRDRVRRPRDVRPAGATGRRPQAPAATCRTIAAIDAREAGAMADA